MKISISYPPLESEKGVPLLSQNRQFQWFSSPTYIYPVVPAYAASLLQLRGHEVIWDDGIAEELRYTDWLARLRQLRPDMVAIESKTPVIKRHWDIIRQIREVCDWPVKTVLFGDHVTALPEESMRQSPVDFVVTGGDYDFVLADLAEKLSSDLNISTPPTSGGRSGGGEDRGPNLKLPGGIWYRDNGQIKSSGDPDLSHDLSALPLIDRELTHWRRYAYKNGNFKHTPGTYIMAGRDCWWGRCSFCSWTTLCPGSTYRTVTPESHVAEVAELVQKYGVREIFDDSGCFPKGQWLASFCEEIIRQGLNRKVVLGCNMRVGALSPEEWRLLKRANFRFILIGLESLNQNTLDRLHKGIRVTQIEETIRDCKAAGLQPHITTMIGYPWETREEAMKTVAFAKEMFTKGLIDSLQATIVTPYPGTSLFDDAKANGWLTTEDWDDYDMKQSVWKSPVSNADVLSFTQDLYRAAMSPAFIARKVVSIRTVDDLSFLLRAGRKVLSHIIDFRSGPGKTCQTTEK